MYLTELTQQELCREAEESAPREICGFVMKDGRIHEMRNVNRIDTRWSMDRAESIHYRYKHRGKIKGTYHSHPSGITAPGPRDIELCPPRYQMWIVTTSEVWRWFTHDDRWIGVNESTFRAAGLLAGSDGFGPESTSVAYISGPGRKLSYVSVARIDELRPCDPSLADRIREEANA